MADTMHHDNNIYKLGSYSLTVDRKGIIVASGNQSVRETWSYYLNVNGSLMLQHLNIDNITHILNNTYDLLGITLSNQFVKADEIYYLNGNSLDTSLSVRNLFDGNITPIVTLSVDEFHKVAFSMIEVDGRTSPPQSSNIVISNPRIAPYMGVMLGPFSLMWNQAVGLMGPIGIRNNSNGIGMVLSLFDTTLLENQTISLNLGSNYAGVNLDNSPSPTSYPFYNSPSDIWNTNNQVVGQILQSANGPNGAVPNDIPEDMQFSSSLSAGSYVVNQIRETISLTGTSTGVSQTSHIELEDDYYQNYNSQTASIMQLVVTILVDGLHAYGIPVPNPFDLILHSSSTNQESNTYTINHAAGSYVDNPVLCGRTGQDCYLVYNVLGTNYGFLDLSFKPSLTFGFYMRITNEYNIGGTTSNPAYNYYDFSVTYGITDSSSHTSFYQGTNNLYFNLAQST